MAISAMGIAPVSTQASTTSLVQMQDFLKIMVTELNYQDPLEPMNNQEFLGQMAQFSTLDQIQRLNTAIQNLSSIQAASQGLTLLGKSVTASGSSGNFSGTVSQLTFTSSGEPNLTITGSDGTVYQNIALNTIQSVK